MLKKIIIAISILIPVSIVAGLVIYATTVKMAILSPSGEIARRQFEILSFAFWLSMFVLIPVFILLIVFSIRYRASTSKKTKYTPDWADNRTLETIWWGIPIAIILLLSVITWRTSHTLDPYRPLDSTVKPLEVQVIALQWKWLFLYPEENIAVANHLVIPEGRPINFTITADAPMNSFWIPKLGGQIYAMNGMSTKLHLIADEMGEFEGMSSNISGKGFADMHFKVNAIDSSDFTNWINNQKSQNTPMLSSDLYHNYLAQPSSLKEPEYYSSYYADLYDEVIDKYMAHTNSTEHMKMDETDGYKSTLKEGVYYEESMGNY